MINDADWHDAWSAVVDEADLESWSWPSNCWDERHWMIYQSGMDWPTFAPWGDRDAPAECVTGDCNGTPASECEHDARNKWGYKPNYASGEQIEMARTVTEPEWQIDAVRFIQREHDRYMHLDFDKVRDPETGRVHPAAIAYLALLGPTYVSVSQSGTGLHAIYIGDTPAGCSSTPDWALDDEPFVRGKMPHVEIYAGKRVIRTTGKHVVGTPGEAREIDCDALAAVLKAGGESIEDDNGGEPVDDRPENSVAGMFDSGWGDDIDALNSDDDRSESTGSSTSPRVTTNAKEVADAVNKLDARDVAGRTIVREWTDTSRDVHSFLPVWGSSGDGGSANIVDADGWKDTGHDPGAGGPVEMAAIDLSIINHTQARWGRTKGSEWAKCVRHLNDLGFDVPFLASNAGDVLTVYDDDWRDDGMTALHAWIDARDDDALPEDAEPPEQVVRPIVDYLIEGRPGDASDGVWGAAAEALPDLTAEFVEKYYDAPETRGEAV